MQMKTTMSYHFTLVRMATIKNTTDNMLASMWRSQREALYSVDGNVNGYSHCGKQYGGSSKKEKRTTDSTPSHIFKEKKTLVWKGTCNPVFTAAWFTVTNIWKQSKCLSTDEWIKKMCVCIHTRTHMCVRTQWSTTQPRKMKICHLQQHGCTWMLCLVK